MKIIIKHLFFFIAVLLLSCNENNNKKLDNSAVVFEIGDIKYYGYNFNDEVSEFKNSYISNYGSKPSIDSVKNSFSDILDVIYVSREARDLKVDTFAEYINFVNGMSHYKMASIKGYLWNALVEPQLIVSNEEVELVYNKMAEVYNLTLYISKDRNILEKYSGAIKSKDFDQLKAKGVEIKNYTTSWPYGDLFEHSNIIENLVVNQITSPVIIANNFAVIQVDKIEKQKIADIKVIKEQIIDIVKRIKTTKIASEKEETVLSSSKYKINADAFNAVLSITSKLPRLKQFDIENRFNDIKNKILFTYSNINGESKNVLVSAFNDYYFFKPVNLPIADSVNLALEITTFIIDDFFWDEGVKLGLNKSDEYIYSDSWYKIKALNYYYIKNVIEPKIQFTELDIKQYYDKNNKLFSQPIKGTFLSISFQSYQNALKCTGIIDQYGIEEANNVIDKNKIEGVLKRNLKQDIDYKENKVYDENTISILKELVSGKSQILIVNNKHTLFFKLEEDVLETLDISTVREKILDNLKIEKINKVRNELLINLKANSKLKTIEGIDRWITVALED